MEPVKLAKWIKLVLAGAGLCGLFVYAAILPAFGLSLVAQYPELGYCYRPWLIFLCLTGVPCYVALALGWRIAGNIGRNRSFCMENAGFMRWIAWLAAGDAAFFFLGNLALWLGSMNHPSVMLASLLVVFAGVAVTIVAAALSHLIRKAADLQTQSDLTI